MKNFSFSSSPPAVIGILTACVLGLANFTVAQSNAPTVVIKHNRPTALHQAILIQRHNPKDMLTLVVGLRMHNQEALLDLIARQQDPQSPDYRRWITPADFLADYAPSLAEVKSVTDYLQAHNIAVSQTTANRMLLQARAAVIDIEDAFSLTINDYDLRGERHFAADRDPSVPANLASTIASVLGTSSIETLHNFGHTADIASQQLVYTPSQIATAYQYPSLLNTFHGTTIYDGTGTTVDIATAFAYTASDLSHWLSHFKINRTGTITVIPINGGSTTQGYETTLDTEQLAAQVPGANINVYETPDTSFTAFQMMWAQMTTDNHASIYSISWGACESNVGITNMQDADATFAQARAQGIAIFASSGDLGAYDCSTTDNTLAVDFPASDLSVAAVGGTNLFLASSNKRKSETAWTGSGGGISSTWSRPNWQTGPGVPTNKFRNVPDVALNASSTTRYYVYYGGQWKGGWGTSFATPNWAAIWAMGV